MPQSNPLSDESVLHTFDEICEWCKGPVLLMCQKGTGVCSQSCAKMASKILYSDSKKAKKFGGGYAPPAA